MQGLQRQWQPQQQTAIADVATTTSQYHNYNIYNKQLENVELNLLFESKSKFKISYYLNNELKEFSNNDINKKFQNGGSKFKNGERSNL